jgi:ATPase family protein associated with various cellular activities (AAA)
VTKQKSENVLAAAALRKHFDQIRLEQLVTASRTFPITSRVDLQVALETKFRELQTAPIGVHVQFAHETTTIAHLLHDGHNPVVIGPLQHDEVDIGETLPARCLRYGLWLGEIDGMRFAALLSPGFQFGQILGVHVEIAVPPGVSGLDFSRDFLTDVEKLVFQTGSFRGKVISLESSDRYSGTAGTVKVHRLRTVERDEVILPQKTVELLERNVFDFIARREQLQQLGMPVKKGLLFYGPPGTGKTHTIHYLAGQLHEHTTLLVTAEQVGLLDHYFQLARFLQPAIVVIEDVDLIARAREEMGSACEESLLNRLLNEMDGLREDAAILFVLTTNRPEQLEAALASRPGRIDQAIEFPMPNVEGRKKLVRLYARGLPVSGELVDSVVGNTEGASAAFIKELMRRSAQYYLQDGATELKKQHIRSAMEEMLFSGGTLNAKLLGVSVVEPTGN